ncbi:MAG: alpha-L-rhamnosidase N-terminal domain-containing protein [bacterium]
MTAGEPPDTPDLQFNRRYFMQQAATGGMATYLLSPHGRAADPQSPTAAPGFNLDSPSRTALALSPARWIWYPSQRCLPNTFILFRRDLDLPSQPSLAMGWILADSRYALFVNGRRIGFGPAPSDPRWPEADPLDLAGVLHAGHNVLAAQVLYYGHGDGAWPIGKPGFILYLNITTDAGNHLLVSDSTWKACWPRSWPTGHYKRWFLRALQEEFDARHYPQGWDQPEFNPNENWLPAMELDCPPDKPSICSTYPDYLFDAQGRRETARIFPRSIPVMTETPVAVERLVESCWIEWKRPPEEYFACLPPDSFVVDRSPCAQPAGPGAWRVALDGKRGAALTFEWKEQMAGWPYFTIYAPEDTVIEIMVHEAHEPGGPALLNTHDHSWTRFICRAGVNHFRPFDFECCRWLQLHIHGVSGTAVVSKVGMARRMYPWPHPPRVMCSESALQRLFNAAVNTLRNCAQETLVDSMAGERQQYSGDIGHQLHALFYTFGETRQPARFIRTFSQGMTQDGYFLDCWPAYDRLVRIMERQLDLTDWGPLLDHGVGFHFDCYHYYLYTGDLEPPREALPRLLRFAEYLGGRIGANGLLPVENLGVPSVWIDHQPYLRQRHKQCAFNLYAAAMFEHALAPLCRAFGEDGLARRWVEVGQGILASAVRHFWSPEREIFIHNLPWLDEEGGIRLCDRSLATAVLFDQCPGGRMENAVRALAECPTGMGLSFPPNAGWRLWALGKAGRADVIVRDLRERWAVLDSVRLNNTLQEGWTATKDSGSQWSHCPVVPLYVLFMNIVGIKPLAPGFARCEIRPQLADIGDLEVTAYTVRGPIHFVSSGHPGNRTIEIDWPESIQGELIVSAGERLDLEPVDRNVPGSCRGYRLRPGLNRFPLSTM